MSITILTTILSSSFLIFAVVVEISARKVSSLLACPAHHADIKFMTSNSHSQGQAMPGTSSNLGT
jgi:hypothetical protein